MKLLLIIYSFLVLISCQNDKNKAKTTTFLVRDWVRTNDKEDSITYKTCNLSLKGISYPLKKRIVLLKKS